MNLSYQETSLAELPLGSKPINLCTYSIKIMNPYHFSFLNKLKSYIGFVFLLCIFQFSTLPIDRAFADPLPEQIIEIWQKMKLPPESNFKENNLKNLVKIFRQGQDRIHRRITIVGAGPVGLYAAIQAAIRGHSVELYEKDKSFDRLSFVQLQGDYLPALIQIIDTIQDLKLAEAFSDHFQYKQFTSISEVQALLLYLLNGLRSYSNLFDIKIEFGTEVSTLPSGRVDPIKLQLIQKGKNLEKETEFLISATGQKLNEFNYHDVTDPLYAIQFLGSIPLKGHSAKFYKDWMDENSDDFRISGLNSDQIFKLFPLIFGKDAINSSSSQSNEDSPLDLALFGSKRLTNEVGQFQFYINLTREAYQNAIQSNNTLSQHMNLLLDLLFGSKFTQTFSQLGISATPNCSFSNYGEYRKSLTSQSQNCKTITFLAETKSRLLDLSQFSKTGNLHHMPVGDTILTALPFGGRQIERGFSDVEQVLNYAEGDLTELRFRNTMEDLDYSANLMIQYKNQLLSAIPHELFRTRPDILDQAFKTTSNYSSSHGDRIPPSWTNSLEESSSEESADSNFEMEREVLPAYISTDVSVKQNPYGGVYWYSALVNLEGSPVILTYDVAEHYCKLLGTKLKQKRKLRLPTENEVKNLSTYLINSQTEDDSGTSSSLSQSQSGNPGSFFRHIFWILNRSGDSLLSAFNGKSLKIEKFNNDMELAVHCVGQ